MTSSSPGSPYALGNTEFEHRRLAWQAKRFDPLTERLFRAAGIGAGQRVLDLGSGAGDVAMLAARLVGPSGEVVGVERDPRSIVHAEARVAEAGLLNVTFTQSEVSQISKGKPFDAAVGRFILMYVPNPAGVVRTLARMVRPGGVIAFHEPSWAAFLQRCSGLPLCAACAYLIHETWVNGGTDTDVGLKLPQIFEEAGMPAPSVKTEILLGNAGDFPRFMVGLLESMRPQIQSLGLPFDTLGDLATLADRLQIEVDASRTDLGGPAFIGAWSTVPSGPRE